MRLSFFKEIFKSTVIIFLSSLVFLKSINIFFKCSWIVLEFSFQKWLATLGSNFNKNSRFKSSRSRFKVPNANTKFQFIFWNTTANFSFEAYKAAHPALYDRHTCTCHIKPSKLQKWIFHHYKTWERKLASVCFLKNLERQKEN